MTEWRQKSCCHSVIKFETIWYILPSPGSLCFRNLRICRTNGLVNSNIKLELKYSFLCKTRLVNHFWFRWIYHRNNLIHFTVSFAEITGGTYSSVGVPCLEQSSVLGSCWIHMLTYSLCVSWLQILFLVPASQIFLLLQLLFLSSLQQR